MELDQAVDDRAGFGQLAAGLVLVLGLGGEVAQLDAREEDIVLGLGVGGVGGGQALGQRNGVRPYFRSSATGSSRY